MGSTRRTCALLNSQPLLKILIANLKELLETRCDYKSSLAFTEGIYQQKLTDLILINTPVSSTGLVSAVMSKNSNIRRLKSLKEKQNMNLFSKLMVSLLLISGIVILTFPVSSSDIFASNKLQKINQSVTKPLPKDQIKSMTKDQVMLEFTIQSNQTTGSKEQEEETEFSILVNYSQQASVEISDLWKIELMAAKISKNIFLKLKLFELNGKQQKLVAEPEISFKFNEEASVSLTQENGKQITLNVLAKEKAHLEK